MAILFGSASFRMVRGTRWDDDIVLTDEATGDAVDLTGVERVLMRIRASTNSTSVLLELSTELANGRLVILDAAAGRVGIRVNSQTTHDSFPANNNRKAKYVYDALIERTTDEYEPAVGGKVTVLPQISRPLDDA